MIEINGTYIMIDKIVSFKGQMQGIFIRDVSGKEHVFSFDDKDEYINIFYRLKNQIIGQN